MKFIMEQFRKFEESTSPPIQDPVGTLGHIGPFFRALEQQTDAKEIVAIATKIWKIIRNETMFERARPIGQAIHAFSQGEMKKEDLIDVVYTGAGVWIKG